jgi:putative transcriptional regulator
MTSLAPAFLLSMPQLLDPNFARTVVLLCRHNEEGAFGLVVNRPAVTTGRVVVGGAQGSAFEGELEVWLGGPVDPDKSWVLVGGEEEAADSALRIVDGLYLSASPDLLRRLFGGHPPARARLVVGYSGWSPGQLEAEIEESSWLLSDIDPAILFETAADQMWEAAIRRLGADPAALHGSRGVH